MINIIKKHWDLVILLIFIFIYIATFSTLSLLRHLSFASNFDLSNMDNTMWNTLHGHFFSFRLGDDLVSRFSIHADIILIFLSPIFFIYNYARALLIIQTLFIGLGSIPTYLISLKLLKNKILSLSIVLIFLLNPGIQWTNIYDFHGVSLAIPFLLFTFYFALTKRWWWFSLFAFLSITTKEQISLTVAVIGLIIFFVLKERKIGAITFTLSVLWFFTMVFIVMPYFSPNSRYWAVDQLLSNSLYSAQEIQSTPQLPTLHKNNLIDNNALQYYKSLIEPFGYLPIFGLPWLLLSSPDLLINVLSSNSAMKTIRFHYVSGLIPGLVISSIYGLFYLKNLTKKIKRTKKYSNIILYTITGGAIFLALRFNYFYSPLPTTPSCWCFIYNVTEEDKEFKKILNQIPQDAKVSSSLEIRPHISHRLEVYSVPSATESADFIALITQNRIIGNYEPKIYENELIPILLGSPKHELVYKNKHFYLFKRKR